MARTKSVHVVGIDGCPGGWVAVSARNGRFAGLATYPDIGRLVTAHSEATVFGIDIPLSFPSGGERRPGEEEAKDRLGSFRSSLFFTPPRNVLERRTYEKANARSKSKYKRGISRQSYALSSKIFQAVRFIEQTGESRLHEVHPELSFRSLAESVGEAVRFRKKRWSGAAERYRLLEMVSLAPPLHAHDGLGKASVDDVLDAAVAAWSAQRIASGEADKIGQASEQGSTSGIIFA